MHVGMSKREQKEEVEKQKAILAKLEDGIHLLIHTYMHTYFYTYTFIHLYIFVYLCICTHSNFDAHSNIQT